MTDKPITLRLTPEQHEKLALAADVLGISMQQFVVDAIASRIAYRPGTRVRKTKGSSWNGRIVGHYSTTMTPIGVAVESEREPGSVQVYPAHALERVT